MTSTKLLNKRIEVTIDTDIYAVISGLMLEFGALDVAKAIHSYDPTLALDVARHINSIYQEYKEAYAIAV
jgi:hypothetical protein